MAIALPRPSRSEIYGCRTGLIGMSGLSWKRAGQTQGRLGSPEGRRTHIIGLVEDVHAENERSPATQESESQRAAGAPLVLGRA